MAKKTSHGRTLTPLGAWALAFGSIVGWGAFIMPGTSFLPNGGPLGTAIGFGIGAGIMVLIAVNYRVMIRRFPRSGGSFVYAQEAFGTAHGFACGWFLVLAFVSFMAQNAAAIALISRNLMNHVLEFGFSYSVAGYRVSAGEVLVSLVLLAILYVVAVRSRRLTYVLETLFVASMMVFLVVVAVVLVQNPGGLAACAPAFNPGKNPVTGTLVVLSMAPWAFLGFDVISQTADEFTFPIRRAAGIMVAAILAGFLFYVLLTVLGAAVVPEGFAGWPDYVAALGSLDGIRSVPVFNAVFTLMGARGILLLDVAALGAVLSGMLGFGIGASRLLCAMADAGQLPSWTAFRHPRSGAPAHALLLAFIGAAIFQVLGRSVLTWVMDMSSVGAALSFLYTSAATWKYAKAEGRTALKVTGAVGAGLSAVFILLLVVPIPQVGASLGVESLVFLAAWVVLGLNFYMPHRQKAPGEAEPSEFRVTDDAPREQMEPELRTDDE